MINLHLSAFAPRWRFLYAGRFDAYESLMRECIINKINLRRVQKDCHISYAGDQYSLCQQSIGGKDVAVVVLANMLTACYKGRQIGSAPGGVGSETLWGPRKSALPLWTGSG